MKVPLHPTADASRLGPASVVRGDAEPGAQLTGRFDILHDFHSPALGTARRVSVYLPPDHDAAEARYPVLYLQDGQNLFDPGRAFVPGHDWGVDEAAELLIRSGAIAPLIVVGVDHGAGDRLDEYTPTRDTRRKAGGRLGAYQAFLVDELKPWIDRQYRTRPEAGATGLGGSSLGGLAALAIGLARPDVFGRLAVLSPSLWWDRRHALDRARELAAHRDQRIWLDAGTHEGPGVVHHARMLKNILVRRGWRLGGDLHYREIAGGQHSEADWARRVPDVLQALFPPGT
jgi:enterochelin esterase-like enzyme